MELWTYGVDKEKDKGDGIPIRLNSASPFPRRVAGGKGVAAGPAGDLVMAAVMPLARSWKDPGGLERVPEILPRW